MALSSYGRQVMLEENPTAKVTIAHPGMDHEVFRPRQEIVRGADHQGLQGAPRVLPPH